MILQLPGNRQCRLTDTAVKKNRFLRGHFLKNMYFYSVDESLIITQNIPVMKKLVSLFLLILPALLSNSCLLNKDNCIECDIYNSYGNYVEYYGSECGNALKTSQFESDADEYASDYYDGWASCYDY
jgi:hypothetical protein